MRRLLYLALVIVSLAACGAGPEQGAHDAATRPTATEKLDRATRTKSAEATAADGGRIAFVSERDGNAEIYVIDADGSHLTRLTDDPASDYCPAWSPAGTRIAFMSERDGNWEIYVMDADGSHQTNLTKNPAFEDRPAWSPDGNRIAFASDREGGFDIYVMDADGRKLTKLTDDPGFDGQPTWSPDASRIAFTSARDGNVEIYAMEANGSGQENLTGNPASDHSPSWSPDGASIAFQSDRDGDYDIYVMGAWGSAPANLTDNLTDDDKPTWSPDGGRITFGSRPDDGAYDVYVMDADGSHLKRLTDNRASDRHPTWGPALAGAATPATVTPPPRPEAVPSDWETYTHPAGLLAFAHPSDWTVAGETDDSVEFDAPRFAAFIVQYGETDCDIQGNDPGFSESCLLLQVGLAHPENEFGFIEADKWDDGVNRGYVAEYTLHYEAEQMWQYFVVVLVAIPNDSNIFHVAYLRPNTQSITSEERDLLRQVISTLHAPDAP
jgi:Tol biopolymer transport system component